MDTLRDLFEHIVKLYCGLGESLAGDSTMQPEPIGIIVFTLRRNLAPDGPGHGVLSRSIFVVRV